MGFHTHTISYSSAVRNLDKLSKHPGISSQIIVADWQHVALICVMFGRNYILQALPTGSRLGIGLKAAPKSASTDIPGPWHSRSIRSGMVKSAARLNFLILGSIGRIRRKFRYSFSIQNSHISSSGFGFSNKLPAGSRAVAGSKCFSRRIATGTLELKSSTANGNPLAFLEGSGETRNMIGKPVFVSRRRLFLRAV